MLTFFVDSVQKFKSRPGHLKVKHYDFVSLKNLADFFYDPGMWNISTCMAGGLEICISAHSSLFVAMYSVVRGQETTSLMLVNINVASTKKSDVVVSASSRVSGLGLPTLEGEAAIKNVKNNFPSSAASHPKRHESSAAPPCESHARLLA
jgi:hypothetical protein